MHHLANLGLRYLLALLFIGSGIMHFSHPDLYLPMMPPYLPEPLLLIYLSGIAELGLGILVLIERWRKLASWGLIALLIAVFPANVHMALHPENFPSMASAALWARLPAQALLIAWTYAVGRQTRAV